MPMAQQQDPTLARKRDSIIDSGLDAALRKHRRCPLDVEALAPDGGADIERGARL